MNFEFKKMKNLHRGYFAKLKGILSLKKVINISGKNDRYTFECILLIFYALIIVLMNSSISWFSTLLLQKHNKFWCLL